MARFSPREVFALTLVLAIHGSATGIQAGEATASSEWGPGYGAAQAADTIRDENGNYWQTVQGTDKGAWWQQDFGRVVTVEAVEIAWASYQDRVHCPPASVMVQVSENAADGPWQEVRRIAAEEVPHDGQPYAADRPWRYALSQPARARFVRVLFPEGGQPGAKYPGYLCLGEVEVQAPELAPKIVKLEGRFGVAELDVNAPSLRRLLLSTTEGLTQESLLARVGPPSAARSQPRTWAAGAYTYVVGPDGKRYESRLTPPEKVDVEKDREGANQTIRLHGIKLVAADGEPPVAVEDWTLSASDDNAQLVWTISRTWLREFTATVSGSPGLFFTFNARRVKNSVTSTIWYDPIRIAAGRSSLYELVQLPKRVSENHLQTIRDRDPWAIYKLWTNWHCPVDLRLEVKGGHLYRRGSAGWLSEAGAVTGAASPESRRSGEREELSLRISAVDKQTTGYQLAVRLPDEVTERSLKDFYSSVLNGGAVNDQKGFDLGNETDGWYYAGSSWMYGRALAAGVPATGQLSAYSYDVARAFREHLLHIVSVVDDQGRAHFGYNQGGEWVDDNLHTILGAHAYLVHTGDVPFVRQILPALERMLAYFIQRRNEQGLFKLDDVGAHWYYDAINTSGVNGYYNAFFYKAACDLAEMEMAAGRPEKTAEYRELADSIQTAFQRVFWREDLPGGPRFIDWIDARGNEVAYFCDLCQWPPIAVGLATPEQARKIVATADARIAELEREFGYAGYAGLSALWPVPEAINPHPWQKFGTYMNGGSLLCQTYWEIVARARAGDATGAAKRLKLFAKRAAEISWAGDNAANIQGEMANGDGEPYLADMVVVCASAVHGILGITPTWDRLDVSPHLPPDWPRAEAEILYKGRRHRVVVDHGHVEIQPLEQVFEPRLVWFVDANFRTSPTGVAELTNIDLADESIVVLPRTERGFPASGSYRSPPWNWTEPAMLTDIEVAADLNSGRVTAVVETSNDGFQTVASSTRIAVQDGAQRHALEALNVPATAVRIGFELLPGKEATTTPVVDAFRVTARAVQKP